MTQCVELNADRLWYGAVVELFWIVSIGYDVLIIDLVLDADVSQFLLTVADFFLLLVS